MDENNDGLDSKNILVASNSGENVGINANEHEAVSSLTEACDIIKGG